MLPKTHFIFSLIFSFVLYVLGLATPLQALIVLAAGVLIDVDHWLVYVIKKKDLSVRRAYKWFSGFHERKEKKRFLCIFHTLESFLLVLALSLRFQIFFFVFWGMVFHMLLDLISIREHRHYGKYHSIILRILKTPKGKSLFG